MEGDMGERRGLQDHTALYFISINQSLENQHLRQSVFSLSNTACTLSSRLEVSLVIWTIWSVS